MTRHHHTCKELLTAIEEVLTPILEFAQKKDDIWLAESTEMHQAHNNLRQALFWVQEHERLYGESAQPEVMTLDILTGRLRDRLYRILGSAEPIHAEVDPLRVLKGLGYEMKEHELTFDGDGKPVIPDGYALVSFAMSAEKAQEYGAGDPWMRLGSEQPE